MRLGTEGCQAPGCREREHLKECQGDTRAGMQRMQWGGGGVGPGKFETKGEKVF